MNQSTPIKSSSGRGVGTEKKIILGWKVNTEQGNLSFPNYNRANLLYILDILYAQNLIGQKNIWVFIGGIHSMQLAVPIAV